LSERTIIHVNQHVIKHNRKYAGGETGRLLPPLTVKGKTNRKASEAVIMFQGEEVGRFVYRPDHPLPCGAHVWFETPCDEDIEIEVIG
jgi:hypothetical protein